jgi:tRNA A37 threonylcarbamoyladenosine dehydratase
MELTLNDVREWLAKNKDAADVKAFLGEIAPTHQLSADEVKEFLDTQDGKSLLQPMMDSRVTEAIGTYKKGHFDAEVKKQVAARVSEEMAKLNPQETPEQAQIRELKKAFEDERAARERDNLKRQIVETGAQMGVEPFFLEDYLPASFEQGKLYLQKIAEFVKQRESKAKNELLATGFKPGSGADTNKNRVDLSKLTLEQAMQLEMEGKLNDQLKTAS